MPRTLSRVLFVCCVSAPIVAWAAPVQWTLNNVVFNDGGTATGSFTYDANVNNYSLIALVTTPGTAFLGSSYNGQFLQAGIATPTQLVATPSDTFSPSLAFLVRFASPLTNAGGTVALVPGTVAFPLTLGSGESVYFGGPLREVVSGAVSAAVIPLPAAGPIFLAALAILGIARRRRAAATA